MSQFTERLISQLQTESSQVKRFQLIAELIDDGMKPYLIAKKSGLTDHVVRHYSRVNKKVHPVVRELFLSGKISFSLVRAIASLKQEEQEGAARKALSKHVSVQAFRASLRQSDNEKLLRDMERFSEQLSSLTGLDVSIQPDKHGTTSGYCVLRYADLDMFDAIIQKLNDGKPIEDY